jgi:prepilin-type N-terminal cleavage/methylation domain-containing protein
MDGTKGFTFLELLIVVTILTLSVSLIFPNLTGKLGSINADKAVQDVVLTLKSYRWEAFSKKEKCEIFSVKGHLWVKWSRGTSKMIKLKNGMLINMEKPWICLSNGAVTEANMSLKLNKKDRQYKIQITAVEGKVEIERVKM